MKKKILLFVWCILASLTVFSQDKIITRDAKTIEAIILEINIDDLRYRRVDNPTGPIYTIQKSEIASVIYANGRAEVFDVKSLNVNSPQKNELSTDGDIIGVIGNGGCYFNPQNPLPIDASTNVYSYGNYAVSYSTIQYILNNVDVNLGREFQRARNMEASGVSLSSLGLTFLGLSSIFVFSDNNAFFITGVSFASIGFILAVPVGLPLWLVGEKRTANVINQYNMNLSRNMYSVNPPLELRLIGNQNGIGFAIAF